VTKAVKMVAKMVAQRVLWKVVDLAVTTAGSSEQLSAALKAE
jgi:hypothetical protein